MHNKAHLTDWLESRDLCVLLLSTRRLYCRGSVLPLLRMLRKMLQGHVISNFRQKDITYMDDIIIVSSSEEDLVIFDEAVRKFGAQSGFMLSRDKSL